MSADAAPLEAIMFLEKSGVNRITPLADRREILGKLLSCLIRPLVTADWWESMLDLMESIARDVPCCTLEFDRSGKIVELLEKI